MEEKTTVFTPVTVERNGHGLIAGLSYAFKQDFRRVDWRAMVPKEYLVPNRQYFERMNLPIPNSIEGLDDKQLLILLDGIKYLADLRGFYSVRYTVDSNVDRTTVVCEIVWMPNFETEMISKVSSGVGDASCQNTSGFGNLFLGPIAENRAFVRAVRNFLKVEILGKDEIDGVQMGNARGGTTNTTVPQNETNKDVENFKTLMKKKSITFDILKDKLVKEGVPGAVNFQSVEDLPKPVLYNMTERLGKKKVPKPSK